MRVVFVGNANWSVPSLEGLAHSLHEVALVATRAAKPAGRGSRLVRTPVAEAAERLGLPLAEIQTVKSGPGFAALAEAAPELLAVVAYGEILPGDVLELPTVAPVNVHFSLLPALRGASPVQRAILEGLEVTGVTTIRMDEGMDTGPILLQAEERIGPDDDAGSLGERLAVLGGRLLVRTLDGLEAGTLRERAQDHTRATYAKKLGPEDRVIDWNDDALSIVRRVRAMAPEPAATTTFRGKVLKVFRATAEPGSGRGVETKAGRVALVSREGLAVAAGDGVVRLVEVAPEARRRMSGPDFVRGYRPRIGETLG